MPQGDMDASLIMDVSSSNGMDDETVMHDEIENNKRKRITDRDKQGPETESTIIIPEREGHNSNYLSINCTWFATILYS